MDILGDSIAPATDEDYGREYLGYEISCKVGDSLDEAIEQITQNIERYELGMAAQKVYDFLWSDYLSLIHI